ncbi:MIP family Ig-specific serine endopeptidase [Mycoplasmopsis felifaucium]|uniref:MIP family Ig-specific serine endopeptidase n=1 Tax=Mycoplasmopsis felifaucium TaxID=35768 RepID=UPI0006898C93|nr:DUF31 family protein [Mycoplasmopsis felifaucium]
MKKILKKLKFPLLGGLSIAILPAVASSCNKTDNNQTVNNTTTSAENNNTAENSTVNNASGNSTENSAESKQEENKTTAPIEANKTEVENKNPETTEEPAQPNLSNPMDIFEHIKKMQEQQIKKHNYNMDVSKFTQVDRNTIYKELFDRTLAIKFGTDLDPNKTNSSTSSFLASSAGTTWLLDYHKYNENKYKLFFATNLHVASLLSNTNEFESLNYKDPRGYKTIGISFGKADTFTGDTFEIKPNGTTTNHQTKWIANQEEFKNASYSDNGAFNTEVVAKTAISNPKLVFAGFDFIDRSYLNEFQEDLKKQVQDEFNNLSQDDQNDKDSKYWIYNHYLKTKEFIPLYTDFAVFEVDVDLSLLNNNYAQWFKDAINGLNRYLTRLQNTPILPNQNKDESSYMQTVDYTSAYNNNDNQNLQSSKYTYVLGYPGTSTSGMSVLDYNNPAERYDANITTYNQSPSNDKAFNLPIGRYNEKISFNQLNPYTSVFGRVLGDHYGYVFQNNFSSLTYGSSGSLVYNEFGQMVGIHSLVDANASLGDLTRNAYFTPFLLSNDAHLSNNKVIKAYNLIDGTDKTKYPAQTHSYRENLKVLYSNGFDDNSFTTALFANGFK